METQHLTSPVLPLISAHERRRYPRTLSHIDAVVRSRRGREHYEIRNLSVCGALMTQGPPIPMETLVEIDLHIADHSPIRVMARVNRRGRHDDGKPYTGVEFLHRSDHTEDLIQAALLDEIERSQTHGIIPQFD